jgi:hypothetical protein
VCPDIGKNPTSIRCWYAFRSVNINELPTEIVWSVKLASGAHTGTTAHLCSVTSPEESMLIVTESPKY